MNASADCADYAKAQNISPPKRRVRRGCAEKRNAVGGPGARGRALCRQDVCAPSKRSQPQAKMPANRTQGCVRSQQVLPAYLDFLREDGGFGPADDLLFWEAVVIDDAEVALGVFSHCTRRVRLKPKQHLKK